jgi:uncharacterized protein (DUF58 family)
MSLRPAAYVLLIATALLAVLGEWAGDAVPSAAGCLPAALLLLGLAWERLETSRLGATLDIEAPDQWLLARPTRVTLVLRQAVARVHDYLLAPQAADGIQWPGEVRNLGASAAAPARLVQDALPQRLGRKGWPVQRLRVAGHCGLAWWSLRLQPRHTFRVVPDVLRFNERGSGLSPAGSRASVVAGAGGQVDQLRDYRPGDPLRVLDWKATARRGALTSREFVDEQHVDVILAVDVGRASTLWCGDLDRLGHYVNVAARFAQHAIDQGDRVGLELYAERPLLSLPPAGGSAAIVRIRSALAGVESRTVDSNPLPLAAGLRTLARQRSLVVLLTDIDDAASSGQLVGAVRLLQPKHLPLVAGLTSAALAGYEKLRAQDWLDPYLALAARLDRQHRDRAIRALASAGAPALVARPEHLEREVFARYAEFRSRRRV